MSGQETLVGMGDVSFVYGRGDVACNVSEMDYGGQWLGG